MYLNSIVILTERDCTLENGHYQFNTIKYISLFYQMKKILLKHEERMRLVENN